MHLYRAHSAFKYFAGWARGLGLGLLLFWLGFLDRDAVAQSKARVAVELAGILGDQLLGVAGSAHCLAEYTKILHLGDGLSFLVFGLHLHVGVAIHADLPGEVLGSRAGLMGWQVDHLHAVGVVHWLIGQAVVGPVILGALHYAETLVQLEGHVFGDLFVRVLSEQLLASVSLVLFDHPANIIIDYRAISYSLCV